LQRTVREEAIRFSGEVEGIGGEAIIRIKYRDQGLKTVSHNDIGYTDLQPNVERKQWSNLETAIRSAHRTASAMAATVAGTRAPLSYCASLRAAKIEAAINRTVFALRPRGRV
jgi:hypothetical protein